MAEVARLLSVAREAFLSQAELEALDGKISTHGVIIPQPPHDRERP